MVIWAQQGVGVAIDGFAETRGVWTWLDSAVGWVGSPNECLSLLIKKTLSLHRNRSPHT